MKRSRAGTTLVELIAVLGLLSVFTMILSPLLPSLLKDIPAAQQAASTQRQIAGVLQRMQQDMDRAVALPAAAGDKRADEQTLLIQTGADTVIYEWADGRLTRSESHGQRTHQSWQMPDGVIRWRNISDRAVQALEVRTAVKIRLGSKRVERLASARVYCIGGLGPGTSLEAQP